MKYSDIQIGIRFVSYLMLLAFIVISTSCKKEPEDPTPNPTYFDDMSANINGQAWKASCTASWPGMGCTKVDCQYYEDTKGFEIFATSDDIGLTFFKTGNQGGISIGGNLLPERKRVLRFYDNTCSNCCLFDLDTSYINNLEIIQIEKSTKLIEGKFNIRVVNSECNDTILIENGYFKTNYRP